LYGGSRNSPRRGHQYTLLSFSGGFKTIKYKFKRFTNSGFAVYAPDFWRKHGLTNQKRMETFSEYREPIGKKLTEIVELIKQELKVDKKYLPLVIQMEDFGCASWPASEMNDFDDWRWVNLKIVSNSKQIMIIGVLEGTFQYTLKRKDWDTKKFICMAKLMVAL